MGVSVSGGVLFFKRLIFDKVGSEKMKKAAGEIKNLNQKVGSI